MMLLDIAAIVFVCTTINHLGLIAAIEEKTDTELEVVNCPKCLSFWVTLTYSILMTHDIILSPAISLLASYTAIWLELLEGCIDKLYDFIYDKIYTAKD